jgi:hypothetical protein
MRRHCGARVAKVAHNDERIPEKNDGGKHRQIYSLDSDNQIDEYARGDIENAHPEFEQDNRIEVVIGLEKSGRKA